VRQNHRVVEKKRLLLVPGDKIKGEVVDERRSVAALGVLLLLALKFEAGIGIARWTAGLLPEQRLIKPEVLRGIRFFPELPFATNPGGLARRLQKVREGRLRAGQGAKV
jgi:hypothetical protein